MNFSTQVYNQTTISYSQSRKIPIKTPTPERKKKNGNGSSTKEWVLKSFYAKSKAADTKSISPLPSPKPSPARTTHRPEDPEKKVANATDEPSIYFEPSRVSSRAEKFRFCLVGKFPGYRPSLALIREWIGKKWRLRGKWSVTLLDDSHVFVKLDNQADMIHVWARKRWIIKGHLMKVFKWSPDFRPSDGEPSTTAVWVAFPSLPLALFEEEFLFSIGGLVGKVFVMDEPTRNMTRTNVARLCVEVDLCKKLPRRLRIAVGQRGFWQDVNYENLPSYCAACHIQGHSTVTCKGNSGEVEHIVKSNAEMQANRSAEQSRLVKFSESCTVTGGEDEKQQYIKDSSAQLQTKGSPDDESTTKYSSELKPRESSAETSRKRKEKGETEGKRKSSINRKMKVTSAEKASQKGNDILIGRVNDEEEKNESESLCQNTKYEEHSTPPKHRKSQERSSDRSPATRRVVSSKNRFFFWKRKSTEANIVNSISEITAPLGLKQYKYSEIKKMTRYFSDILGRGGFGTVYKGTLPGGRPVAVKVTNSEAGEEEFVSEVEIIGRTYHVNIVRLLGFCAERSHKALIYEYISNGSLDRFIHAESPNPNHFTCHQLLEVALGIARGLQYLHHGCSVCIIHSDIKPRNILLDEFFCPKISDFGLARMQGLNHSSKTSIVRGTNGYIAPEHYLGEKGSRMSDVYSYGVMLLEMVVRRKPFDSSADDYRDRYLLDWVNGNVKRQAGGGLGLGGIAGVAEEEEARKMVIVGLSCVRTHPWDRPAMNMVVRMLEGDIAELQVPPDDRSNLPDTAFTPSVNSNANSGQFMNSVDQDDAGIDSNSSLRGR